MFVTQFGAAAGHSRPPSVEAYLPIAALISLKHLAVNKVFDAVHPAGLAIFLAITGSALMLRRGFCSWICPVGTVSELTHKLGATAGINLRPHPIVDIPLRALKYLVLGFFVSAILSMDADSLGAFIDSPFNKIADVRMLYFFLEPSRTTILVLTGLFLLSLVIKNFWCRYLCPYGALLGFLSKLGPVRVERDERKCVDCRKCEQACPAYIKVADKKKVTSSECTMCTECVDACTETRALSVKTPPRAGKKLTPKGYGLVLVGLFLAVILTAQATGHWRTNISTAEYRQIIPAAGDPMYRHP